MRRRAHAWDRGRIGQPDIDLSGAVTADRGLQGSLCLCQFRLVIAGVYFGKQITLLDHLVIVDIDLGDVTGHFRADLNDMCFNESIIR